MPAESLNWNARQYQPAHQWSDQGAHDWNHGDIFGQSPQDSYNEPGNMENDALAEDSDRYGDVSATEPSMDAFPDPNNFDFSFSEDDLLPTQLSNTQFEYNDYPSYDMDHTAPGQVYGSAEVESKERRITIQRAYLISEPQISVEERPESSSRSIKKEDNASRRLSRTISTLRRRTKSSTTNSPVSNDSDAITPTVPDRTSSIPSNFDRRPSSRRERSRGRTKDTNGERRTNTKGEEQSSYPAKTDAQQENSRPRSQDSKKRRSFRWEKAPKPTSDTTEAMPEGKPVVVASTPVDRPFAIDRNKGLSATNLNVVETSNGVNTVGSGSPRKNETLPTFVKSFKMPVRPAAKPKDEMWSLFRSLENDHEKLQTKPAGSKAGAVESMLLPFLRNNASDKSCDRIHVERLEKRCKILSLWWAALLNLAEQWDSEKLSFRELFTIVEGIIGITQRPEWRCVPDFSSLLSRSRRVQDRDEMLEEEVILTESIYHNIRVMFVGHLQRQLALIISRLSQRDPTGALANLGGITCAYAIFFCPGIAGPLMKLWRQPAYIIQKILDSTQGSSWTPESSTSTSFPSSLQSLEYSSVKELKAKLEKKPHVPLGFDLTEWTNPEWLDKWCGQKGDLFNTFIKSYYTLMSDFLPEDVTLADVTRVPTIVLVWTQIMAIVHSAIHFAHDSKTGASSASRAQSNDMLTVDGIDSNALTLPIPPDTARSLAGKRLLALLREHLLERTTVLTATARYLLAQGAKTALKAAVRQTSLYDHNACYNLCDFVEEFIPISITFEKVHLNQSADGLDAAFWADVFLRMLQSGNTLTIMRVFALIFAIWPNVTVDQPWKRSLCHDLLLERDVFYTHFNHWCPLVRIYFFRLIAWRVGRFDGSSNQDDVQVLRVLHRRVQEVWSHYKYLAGEAHQRGALAPSTAPCNPIPGRRLLIIRTEIPASPSSRSFNSSPSPTPGPPRKPSATGPEESHFSATQLFAKLSSTLEERKRSSFLQTFSNKLSTTQPQSRDGITQDVVPEFQDDSEETSRFPRPPQTNSASSRASIYEQRPALSRLGQPETKKNNLSVEDAVKQAQAHFKFSLEAVDRKLIGDLQLRPPRLPLPAQLLLQSQSDFVEDAPASKPAHADALNAKYSGRALAEWTLAINETQNFFERRRREGVTANKYVETPTLSVESFKRPG